MDINNELLIQVAWIIAAILAIFGLKLIYSKVTRGSAETSLLAGAENVIIIPGYGMAVAQAQNEVWELAGLLKNKGVNVSFAISPVAGRMPGHMDVLLAEAGVPYELIHDLDEINGLFPSCDVALVVGANDVVNPMARTDTEGPLQGIPVLDADKARKAIIIKRDQGTGYSGIENPLLAADNTSICYGDARDVVQKLIAEVKSN